MSEQFSREQHLRRKHDFERARVRGARIYRKGFIFQYVRRELATEDGPLPSVRIGIIASRRMGKAHERNLARRRIREIFRKHQHTIPAGYDLVLILRAGIRQQSFAEILEDFLFCLRKLPKSAAAYPASPPGTLSGEP